jgi:hypothetical protein
MMTTHACVFSLSQKKKKKRKGLFTSDIDLWFPEFDIANVRRIEFIDQKVDTENTDVTNTNNHPKQTIGRQTKGDKQRKYMN